MIANSTEIIVTLSENKKGHKARVIGQDRYLDIALIPYRLAFKSCAYIPYLQPGIMNELPRIVALMPPGKNVEVKLFRDGEEKTLYVMIGLKEEDEAMATKDEKESPDKRLGLSVQPLTPDIARRLGITDTAGVIISAVKPDGPASAAGMMRWDVVKEIDRRFVKDMKDYSDAIAGIEKNGAWLFLVFRNNSALYVIVKLTDKE